MVQRVRNIIYTHCCSMKNVQLELFDKMKWSIKTVSLCAILFCRTYTHLQNGECSTKNRERERETDELPKIFLRKGWFTLEACGECQWNRMTWSFYCIKLSPFFVLYLPSYGSSTEREWKWNDSVKEKLWVCNVTMIKCWTRVDLKNWVIYDKRKFFVVHAQKKKWKSSMAMIYYIYTLWRGE